MIEPTDNVLQHPTPRAPGRGAFLAWVVMQEAGGLRSACATAHATQ